MDGFADYEQHDATGLADLVRSGEVHPTELVDAAIARIEWHNPKLNAVVYPDFERAREAAKSAPTDGPFCGVPFLEKDLGAAVAGLPMTQSSRSREGVITRHDNELVQRHRAAGLILLGKTNTPEFGLSPVTEPEVHGPTRNPWDLERTPGGSSGGSAAAVAAGMVPMAHANDGGGSIRTPASACGLFGLKPSRGRSTWGPDYLEGWLGLSEQHAVTRSVRDSARLLDATHGAHVGVAHPAPPPGRPFADEVGTDPGRLRVAFTTSALLDHRPTDQACVAAVTAAAELCGELGHEVVEASPPIDLERMLDAFITLSGAEGEFQLRESERLTGRKVGVGDVELVTWIIGLIGRKRSSGDLAATLDAIRDAGRIMAGFLADHDVLLSSTTAKPPWPIGDLDIGPSERRLLQLIARAPAGPVLRQVVKQLSTEILEPMPNTPLFNMTGQPAMSVPLHWTADGLPVGVQFAARLGDEAVLFRLAAQLEAARPWWNRRAPLAKC